MKSTPWFSWALSLYIATVLLINPTSSSATPEKKEILPAVSEVMARINELANSKIPHCTGQAARDDYVTTHIKSLEEIIDSQHIVLGDLRYMANKMTENVNEYLPEALRANSSSTAAGSG